MRTLVREFHEAFGLVAPLAPTLQDGSLRDLRLRLIREEVAEVTYALDECHSTRHHPDTGYPESVTALTNLAKELADLRYVTEGTAVSYGLDIDGVYEAVHRSNLSKLRSAGGATYRADGKVLKPVGFRRAEPDIRDLIEAQCPRS